MIGGLRKRAAALEANKPSDLPANIKRWLGHALTDAEEQEADRLDLLPDLDVATANITQEDRQWLEGR